MKPNLVRNLVIATLFLVLSYSANAQVKSKNTQLFNGKDLNNWVFSLKDPAVDPKTVFTVQNGVIHIKGDPFGYMRTAKEYSDYNLHVEWRYPVEATNSGVFIHAQKPDTIWPKTIECQLAAGKAGDFICANGTSMNEQKDKSNRVVTKMNPSNEKPVGEWNSMDIKCSGNTVEVTVNGLLQNRGTGLNVSKGSICLQSEGKDIEFRNVFLTTIKNSDKTGNASKRNK
ncbi:MAG TPA: DUF1080 domain-containing protein [Bacteroidales bacterium]|nr:DUF1080 domain-containing protein [Bacteroidales bacterium]